ncbi:hypothetical protein SAMN06264348_106112 [Oceanospirillum linum]|nr:hypothetical protein SAMN04489856_10799 [Oleiphilus messinensis]SMP27432.1 hypothetical protein SAMN06264348_106112 [Oceanospirillum linum]
MDAVRTLLLKNIILGSSYLAVGFLRVNSYDLKEYSYIDLFYVVRFS